MKKIKCFLKTTATALFLFLFMTNVNAERKIRYSPLLVTDFVCSIRNIQKSFLLPFLCAGFIFRCLLEITSNWNEIYKKNCINSKLTLFSSFLSIPQHGKKSKKKSLKKNEMKHKKFFSFIKLSTFYSFLSLHSMLLFLLRLEHDDQFVCCFLILVTSYDLKLVLLTQYCPTCHHYWLLKQISI